MKHLDRLLLTCITVAMIWTCWTLHLGMVRLIDAHESNLKSFTLLTLKAMDERNLAESHVAYLQKEIAKYHRSGWGKNIKGDK